MSTDSILSAAYSSNANAPALGAFAVTPDDDADLEQRVRQITINAGGTVRFTGIDGKVYTTDLLPPGTYPLMARRIYATGTTATGITGWL